MRLLDLARISAEAERLRLRLFARRQALRGVWAMVAALFGLFMLVMLHIVGVAFLAPVLGDGWRGVAWAALAVTGADLVLAAICAAIAMRDSPGLQEREAAAISRAARGQIKDMAAGFAVAAPLAGAVGGGLRGALLTTVVTHFLRRRKK